MSDSGRRPFSEIRREVTSERRAAIDAIKAADAPRGTNPVILMLARIAAAIEAREREGERDDGGPDL